MKSLTKITITVGIPAYNEQQNIAGLITNVLEQTNKNFILKNIIIVSDGSDDNTVEIVKSISDKRVVLHHDKKRLGKIKRINQIFKFAESDAIVIMDADCLPNDKNTIDNLVYPMIKNPDVVYTSGSALPVSPKNFLEKSIQVSRSVWDKVRIEYKNGNSFYSCHGLLYCLKTNFAKKHPFPDGVWTDIGFHFFSCIRDKKLFVSVKSAKSLFRTPSNLKDYLSQIGRYQNENHSLINYFGSWIIPEYEIPKMLLLRCKAETFVSYPLHCLFVYIINFYAKYNKKIVSDNARAGWSTISSTKLKIDNEKS